MSEREKKGIIVAAVVAAILVVLLLRRGGVPAAGNTIVNQAPFSLGDVTLPGLTMPPRGSYGIPTISIPGSDDGLILAPACCATCDSSGPSYYTPEPAAPPAPPVPKAAIPHYVAPASRSVSVAYNNPANDTSIPWWHYVGITGR